MNNMEHFNRNLSKNEAKNIMINIVDMPDSYKSNFLISLHNKGETAEEIAGFADAIRSLSKLKIKYGNLTDIVGTGGDKKNTINVSTAASIVLASMGLKVAKHGNFGITGNHGSADLMKFLGYNFHMPDDEIIKNLNEKGYVYILAPEYNENFAKFASVRKSLGFKTVFNILGPLTNPLNPECVVLGAYDNSIAELYSNILIKDSKRGFVITSEDGMDEMSPFSVNNIYHVDKSITNFKLDPKKFIEDDISIDDISSPDSKTSFEMTVGGMKGENKKVSEFIALNVAPALVANGIYKTIQDAYFGVIEHINEGKVMNKIKEVFNYKD